MRRARGRFASRSECVLVVVVLMCVALAAPSYAQLNTQHLKGGVGLKAGSLPPPGGYVAGPVLCFYSADDVRDRDGNQLPPTANLDASLYGVGYLHVTTKKILGGNYAFQVLFPVGANNRIQGTEIDANPGAGLTDSVVVPINIGWHSKRADSQTSYTLYIPTGRYTDGADDNTGLGMWGHEFGFGTTVYLNEARQYHAATMATLIYSTKKEDSNTQPGSQLQFEGGAGGDFLKGGLTLGLAYYAAFKLNDDEIEGLPGILIRGKNKVFALGPEASLAIARKNTVYGFVRVAYLFETWAQTTTQGGALFISGTFLTKPLKIPTP
jgi:hypothetical protein